MRRSLLFVVPVACVCACSDTTQPAPVPPPPPGILASVAAHTDGPPTGLECFEDSLNVTIDGPHMAVAIVILDPDTTTVCGNLVFDDSVRTLEVEYSIAISEPDYVYWWSGSRDQNDGSYALDALAIHAPTREVDTTFTTALLLGGDYDGIGLVGVNSADPALAVVDSVFSADVPPEFGRNYMLQHWREKLPPLLDSARAEAVVVTLWWRNRHGRRPVDSTVVFRNRVVRRTLNYLASSFVDTVPGAGIYRYTLKHVAGPVINKPALVSPNSASSDSLVVTVGTACATADGTVTWRYADQYLSAGCSLEQGADKRYRWYTNGDVPLTAGWSADTLFDWEGASATHLVILKDSSTTTDLTSRDTVVISVQPYQVELDGASYIPDKQRYLYVATAGGQLHDGQWFERYDDGPQWYPATAYDQDSLYRTWPKGDYTVDLRQHKVVQGVLHRRRLVVDVCSVPGCTAPPAPPVAAGPVADPAVTWDLFGAGPWLGWGGADLRRTVRFYDLWGMPDRASPFADVGWVLGDGGRVTDAETGWQLDWTRRDLPHDDVRAFDLAVAGTRGRAYVFSMAVDPDLGPEAADDVARYDRDRGLVLVADGARALGFLLRAGTANALASVQEYGVGRWAPTIPATAWAAQRDAGVHLRGTPRDVQLVLSAAETTGSARWLLAVIRGPTVAAVQATADAVFGAVR